MTQRERDLSTYDTKRKNKPWQTVHIPQTKDKQNNNQLALLQQGDHNVRQDPLNTI